ncbi:MAG TPA: tRNA pseudouridine(55) synthase TruB [Thermodesulfovibrionales bacterium]|nr:tRNA pseudouridine(55) synthase TruB [Thermodesulfovibrionales bacterium]
MNVIFNLDKPKGISSQQAVTQVKRILNLKKAGHAGTLDPIATGILLVCAGEATKVTRFLSDLDKEYTVLMKFGEKTDTYDAEGKIVEKREDFSFGRKDIEGVLGKFIGNIEQTPPMYSAVKMGGRPLYKLARKGITVDREKRTVIVHRIEISRFDLPLAELKVSCSKGTYVRSLCNDIGVVLGVGAHVVELRRTRIGGFSIEDSVSLNEVGGAVGNSALRACSISDALSHLAGMRLTDEEFVRARKGLPLRYRDTAFSPDDFVRLESPAGNLFAIGKVDDTAIRIERILHI